MNKKRDWSKKCTWEYHTIPEREFWIYRLPQPNAMSVRDAVKIHEKDGYKFVGYGYGPLYEWGAKMIAPEETAIFHPECNSIHNVVIKAWERATPPYKIKDGGGFTNKTKRDRKIYGWLHTQFFSKYHSEYMPSTERIKEGIIQQEVVDLLLEKLDELLLDRLIEWNRWAKTSAIIIEDVKKYIVYEL